MGNRSILLLRYVRGLVSCCTYRNYGLYTMSTYGNFPLFLTFKSNQKTKPTGN